MATRGAVGVGTLNKFVALYNHWDSYPSGLGKEVWNKLQNYKENNKSALEFTETIVQYSEWSKFLCGDMRGSLKLHMSQDTVDTLFIEWIYIIDPENNLLHVLHNRTKDGDTRNRNDYEHFLVESLPLDGYDGYEPNWERIASDAYRRAEIPCQQGENSL